MSLWSFLTGWGSTIGAAAYVTKEVGTAAKTQINFEVREQYRKKFFDEWVDETLEKKLRDDLSTPSKYNEIWERIEKYKEDEGEVYLMRKLFGERQGWRYFWEDVGKTRLQIRNKNGKCATGYTTKEYNNNYWKTMSLLMNTYEKLTVDDAFYIFDICYNSIYDKSEFGVANVIKFDKKDFRRNGQLLLACNKFYEEWDCSKEFKDRIMKELHLDCRTDYEFWRYDPSANKLFNEIWTRIENYKKENGKTCSYLLKLEKLQREWEKSTGEKVCRDLERAVGTPLKDMWSNVGKRRLSFSERQDTSPAENWYKYYNIDIDIPRNTRPNKKELSEQQKKYMRNINTALTLYINTFDKMTSSQSFSIEKYRRQFNM